LGTLTISAPQLRARFRCGWLISRPVDLALVSGSALAGYLYLALYAVFQVPIGYLWWFWSVGFDGTHIFATATRTYLDREARMQSRRLLFGSAAAFFSLGPLMVLAGQKALLALVVGTWAYYHVMRQHYGFLMLYKVKNRDLAAADNRLDGRFLFLMLVAPPVHRFLMHHPEELGLPPGLALARVAPWTELLLFSAVALGAGAFLLRQLERLRASEPLNLPKLLLVGAVIPLHWLTFAFMSWRAAVPTITIAHNLQYHALVWFHNRNKYGDPAAGRRFGRLPHAVSASLLAYAGLGLLFSLAYRLPGYQLGRVSDLAFGFFCGFGLTHYYLDSKIWRVRRDPELRRLLGLA
jgi:hypothetical protein